MRAITRAVKTVESFLNRAEHPRLTAFSAPLDSELDAIAVLLHHAKHTKPYKHTAAVARVLRERAKLKRITMNPHKRKPRIYPIA